LKDLYKKKSCLFIQVHLTCRYTDGDRQESEHLETFNVLT